jgi:hypothetical protein
VVRAPTDEVTVTATPAPEMPGSGGVLPSGGNFLVWAGVGLLVLLLLGVISQLRSSSVS